MAMIGALAIYAELGRPGMYLPGLAGIALLGWGGYELAQYPVSMSAVLWIAIGLTLLLIEVYRSTRLVTPLLGIVFLSVGSTRLVSGLSAVFVVVLCVVFGCLSTFLAASARTARLNKRRDLEQRSQLSRTSE
jgi:membrane-bound ClpP family serine protease